MNQEKKSASAKSEAKDPKDPKKSVQTDDKTSKPEKSDKQDASQDSKQQEQAVEVPKKFKELVEQIEKMSVLELSELVKVLEDKFQVSAQAPIAMAAPGQAQAGSEQSEAQEKTDFNIEITSAGDSKIQVIKAVKDIMGVGLKEAKDLVDAAPKVIKENVAKAEADEIKQKLEQAGAGVELK
ncbi:MAG: 50S ribosomal protein L7/L12 [Candidatus Moranbacteria bacterium]|nr:50S ribosomal protein L7/L12 [Candidatus Moranbacteria bacterium]